MPATDLARALQLMADVLAAGCPPPPKSRLSDGTTGYAMRRTDNRKSTWSPSARPARQRGAPRTSRPPESMKLAASARETRLDQWAAARGRGVVRGPHERVDDPRLVPSGRAARSGSRVRRSRTCSVSRRAHEPHTRGALGGLLIPRPARSLTGEPERRRSLAERQDDPTAVVGIRGAHRRAKVTL
jgi:hypothetical protein